MPIAAPPIEPSETQAAPSAAVSIFDRVRFALESYFARLTEITQTEISWDSTTYLALAALILLWAVRMYTTYGTWGNLSIDSGHEAYVPAVLAQGKMLYRDVFWMYTPLAPYVNAALFHLFGIRLEVLYWAGSLAALGSAILLFLIGKRFSSRLFGWTAGAVVLLQAFHAWHFCFPLPYSFAPVYGCLTACLFLWCAVEAPFSKSAVWIFVAASCAAIALLLKVEFGVACYAALCLIVVTSAIVQRSWRVVLTSAIAALPGLLACALVIRWMISIAGASFITQENIMSWPTHYFMRTYGKIWLEKTGVSLSPAAIGQAAERAVFFAGFIALVYLTFWMKRVDAKSVLLRLGLLAALIVYGTLLGWHPLGLLAGGLFPRDMVLYVCVATIGALWFFWRSPSPAAASMAILLAFSGLLASRLLLKMVPGGYPIYYNGPVVLAFLMLLRPIVPRRDQPRRIIVRSELLLGMGCIAVVALNAVSLTADRSDLVQLITKRGSILVPTQVAANYKAGIAFIEEKNRGGELVLSVPEDVSLYFLSGQDSPTRLFQFSPGVVAPGKMTDGVIAEIEKQSVRYLLWSNRTYADYGTTTFGKDFNQDLGGYLTSHYREVGPLVPHSDLDWETKFNVWERRPIEVIALPSPGGAASPDVRHVQ
jgi:hypothetical protein